MTQEQAPEAPMETPAAIVEPRTEVSPPSSTAEATADVALDIATETAAATVEIAEQQTDIKKEHGEWTVQLQDSMATLARSQAEQAEKISAIAGGLLTLSETVGNLVQGLTAQKTPQVSSEPESVEGTPETAPVRSASPKEPEAESPEKPAPETQAQKDKRAGRRWT